MFPALRWHFFFSFVREKWKVQFAPRNLIALSAEPYLVYPTHYTGEPNYISDTEDSVVIEKGTIVEGNSDEKIPDPNKELIKMDEGSILEAPPFKEEL